MSLLLHSEDCEKAELEAEQRVLEQRRRMKTSLQQVKAAYVGLGAGCVWGGVRRGGRVYRRGVVCVCVESDSVMYGVLSV